MSDEKSQLDELIASLKQQRDQLAVQIELGKAVAMEVWDSVTAKRVQLSKDYEPLKEAVETSATGVFEVNGLCLSTWYLFAMGVFVYFFHRGWSRWWSLATLLACVTASLALDATFYKFAGLLTVASFLAA